MDTPAELETQFILRMPVEPAKALREALSNGATNLRDRFNIKLENDVRYGEVRVDHWLMPAKVVDLPTITESMKTIDNKSFYKTADICQMLICKEDDDQPTDEEATSKIRKKDPNKVDKKFLWPHGITPPTKNVRRRRFRKTLKKKYVEAPEIEKEVKRLLRVDNEAVSVKWEVISEDDEHKVNKGVVVKMEKEPPIENSEISLEACIQDQQSLDIEHDIFGGAVSDSDEDDANINVLEMDETSRLSGEDSRLSDSNSALHGVGGLLHTSVPRHTTSTPLDALRMPGNSMHSMHAIHSMHGILDSKSLVTEFTSDMFSDDKLTMDIEVKEEPLEFHHYAMNEYTTLKPEPTMYMGEQPTKDKVLERMEQLQLQLAELRQRRDQQETEILNIENHALRQRIQETLDNLMSQIMEKEREYQHCQELLQ